MEGTRQEHIVGTCGKETFCGKEQEGEKGSEAGREDKNGGERSGEKEGGEIKEVKWKTLFRHGASYSMARNRLAGLADFKCCM